VLLSPPVLAVVVASPVSLAAVVSVPGPQVESASEKVAIAAQRVFVAFTRA
jgi:hypothetical protein